MTVEEALKHAAALYWKNLGEARHEMSWALANALKPAANRHTVAQITLAENLETALSDADWVPDQFG